MWQTFAPIPSGVICRVYTLVRSYTYARRADSTATRRQHLEPGCSGVDWRVDPQSGAPILLSIAMRQGSSYASSLSRLLVAATKARVPIMPTDQMACREAGPSQKTVLIRPLYLLSYVGSRFARSSKANALGAGGSSQPQYPNRAPQNAWSFWT